MKNSTRSGPEEHAQAVSAGVRDVLGRVRRFAITLTTRALWQVAGHLLPDNETIETHNAPPFTGVGLYARPAADGNPEAIVVFVGGPSNPVIVATRDEKTRAAVFAAAGELAPGEAAIYSPAAIIVAKADGTVEIRTPGGVAVSLATKADVQTIRDQLTAHTHGPGTFAAGASAVVGVSGGGPAVTAPVGTTVLRAQ